MMLMKKRIGSKGGRLKIKAGGGLQGGGRSASPAMRAKKEASGCEGCWHCGTTARTPQARAALRRGSSSGRAGWSGAIYEEISEERAFQHGFGAVSAKRVPARHNAMRLQLLLAGKFAWSYSNQLPIRHQSFCLKADGAALTALHPIELHLSANDRLLLFVSMVECRSEASAVAVIA